MALGFARRRAALARRAYLAWLNHVWGGVSMNMIATKPLRYIGRSEGMGTAQRLARVAADAGSPAQGPPRGPRAAAAAAHARAGGGDAEGAGASVG